MLRPLALDTTDAARETRPHARPGSTSLVVAAVPEHFNTPANDATTTPPPPAVVAIAPDVIDRLLTGDINEPTKPVSTLPATVTPHPLEGIDDVDEAKRVIGELMVAEREAKGTRVYPRRILRQQHIAAYMLLNPFATTTEICAFFGIGPTALSNICKSDTFKALIEAHRISLETNVMGDLQDQLRQTLAVSLEVVQSAVVKDQNAEFALQVLDKTANRLGMGAKHNTNVQINNNVVTPEMIAQARAKRLGNGP